MCCIIIFVPDALLMLSGRGPRVQRGRAGGGAGPSMGGALQRHTLIASLGLRLALLVQGAVLVHLDLLPRLFPCDLFHLLELLFGDKPPVEGGDEEGKELDAGADADILETKHLNVVDEAAAARALTGLGPEKARGVYHVTKQDRAWDVPEQAENDKLDAESEGLLLLPDAPEDDHDDGHLGDGHK